MNSTNEQQWICKDRYAEEQWVDFFLGNLTQIKRQQLEQHLADCYACRQHVEQWGELLTNEGEIVWSNTENPPAVQAAYDEANGSTMKLLSEKHMLSLQRHVKKQARWQQFKKKASNYKYVIAGAAAVMMLLAVPVVQLKPSLSNPAHVDQYVQEYEPAAISFVNATDSARYRIEAAEGQASSGYIWLKEDWSEAFLWLENLQQIGLNDYQAWAISGEQASSLGIIQLVGTEGHLYMNTPGLQPTDFITLTVEPKGGSLTPTSKQVVLIVKHY